MSIHGKNLLNKYYFSAYHFKEITKRPYLLYLIVMTIIYNYIWNMLLNYFS